MFVKKKREFMLVIKISRNQSSTFKRQIFEPHNKNSTIISSYNTCQVTKKMSNTHVKYKQNIFI